MNNKIVNKYSIVAGMIVFAVVSILLIIKIYNLTLQDSKTTHQLQQMQMAKTAVQGIKYYVYHLVGDIHLLAFQLNNQLDKPDEVQSHLSNFLNHYNENIVRSIFITDTSTNVLYAIGDSLPGWIKSEIRKMTETSNSVYYSAVMPFNTEVENEKLFFIILVPDSYKSEFYINSDPDQRVTGAYGYLISFDNLMLQFINPLKLGKSDFVWVLDGEGRLIFHPRHKKMLFRSVMEVSSECMECHSSFEMQKRMVTGDASVGEYTIGDEPPKIMAYVPLNFQDKRWVLVISTLLPEVTADLREKFQYFFILGFLILGAFISFGFLIYYINSKRIRAEEANRNLKQIQDYQEQLNQASKMASIGELIDTVGHEINTPVGIITAHADALLLQRKSSEPIDEELNIIKKQAKRISDYTKGLLNYSQRMPFQPEAINLGELINECIYLLGHRFREKKITVTKKVQPDFLPAFVDRRQMEQVFINLLNNAIDALQIHGAITIEARNVHPKNYIKRNGNSGGISVSIRDNGVGIPNDNLTKIFNPFYSTKPPAKGTGLGLYITKAIIQRHKGKIEVTSKKGAGATFNIFLPSDNVENQNEQ